MGQNVFHILLGLIWLLPGFISGQNLEVTVKYYDESDRLYCSGVNDIHQDKLGYIWLGTREGLFRFDGNSFRAFQNIPGDSTSIYSNHVMKVIEDAKGNIWVGLLRGGVSCYDRKSGKFKNYPFTLKLKNKTAPILGMFFDRDGELWMGVGLNGLVHLDKKSGAIQQYDVVTKESAPHFAPEVLPTQNNPYQFWQDEQGKIYCTTNDGLYCFDPRTGKAEPVRSQNPVDNEKAKQAAYKLLAEGDVLWIGGWGTGLRRFNRKTGAWKQYFFDKTDAVDINIVNDIVRKGADELWITTQEKGLGIFNEKTEQFYFFSDHPSEFSEMPKIALGRFLEDYQGNFWVIANARFTRLQIKNKVFQFHPVNVGNAKGLSPFAVSTLNEDPSGRYLVIGLNWGHGLVLRDKLTGKSTVVEFSRRPEEQVQSIASVIPAGNGSYWVLSRSTVFRLYPDQLRIEKTKQPPLYDKDKQANWYNEFGQDFEGKLWMSTSYLGVIRLDPITGESVHFMPDETKPGSIASNVVGIIAIDRRGRIWYGSRDKTAYGYYDPGKKTFVYLDNQGKITKDLASMRVNNCIADTQGNMMVCTEEGFLYFDCSGEVPLMLKKYRIGDGLRSEYVVSSTFDQQGNIWCITSAGLSKIDMRSDKISSYGKEEGVNFTMHGIVAGSEGLMYLRSNMGYYTFDPNRLQNIGRNAPLTICSFKIDDQEMYTGSEGVPSRKLVVPAESRFFSFEFAAIDFSHPELLQYAYKLENFDDQWVQAGTRRFVTYTNIPAGTYYFKVKLADSSDEAAISVPLTVHVPFYETKWFWAFVAASLAAFTVWFYRNRRRHERQLQELKGKTQLLEKEKAVVMYESLKQQLNPHFLFNSLTSLNSLIQIDQKAAVGFLENLSKSYRYILKSSEQELVPIAEELKFTRAFIELQKTRFREGLFVNFQVPEELLHRKIVPVTLQNMIENAIKHNIVDEESPLIIDVYVEDDFLTVRNNLQKKKFVETSNRKGLHNLQSFYRYLTDRKIEIVEDGTFFTIKIPLL